MTFNEYLIAAEFNDRLISGETRESIIKDMLERRIKSENEETKLYTKLEGFSGGIGNAGGGRP